MSSIPSRQSSGGFALLGALLLLLLLSAMAVAMVYMAGTETRIGGIDRENTLAYYGAEAGMEQMIADVSATYNSIQAPTQADIDALEASQPSLPDVQYSVYDLGTLGTPVTRNLTTGPNAGLIGIITPLSLNVTARRPGGAEVSMSRDVEVALIPIFQFARFSGPDLSYEPSPPMIVGGRVHTNGHLFVSSWTGPLRFQAKVTAVGQVVRDVRQDGGAIGGGEVWIPTAATGCTGGSAPYNPNCRRLNVGEGSVIGWWNGPANGNWPTISTGTPPSGHNGFLLNGGTGARRLDLPFMQPGSGLRPIEIIRRPRVGEQPGSPAGQSRLYNKAQIRILISDSKQQLLDAGVPDDAENVRLYNDTGTAYPSGVPVPGVSGGNTYFASGRRATDGNWVKPSGYADTDYFPLLDGTTTVNGGWLRVEVRKADGTYMPVTKEWLQLGFARGLNPPNSETGQTNNVHPNAILIFQLLADRNNDGDTNDSGETTTPGGSTSRDKWFPINLYDTREGEVNGNSYSDCALGGIFNVVELDVANLRKWLFGTIGTTGMQVEDTTQNGFILYFSDRRGMLPNPNLSPAAIIGEYGFEDTHVVGNGLNPVEEDVNENGVLDTYGANNLGNGFGVANGNPYLRVNCMNNARRNRVSGARHGLKVVNGSLGNLPTRRNGTGGFTVASENIVYEVGNYNANNAGYGNPHAAAAIITDMLVLLSNNWKDLNSFTNPTDPGGRPANTTWYRTAIIGGMNRKGAGSVIIPIEGWSGINQNWMGSMVNLYWTEQGTSLSECCTVYSSAIRNWVFDTDFLTPENLPPGTPMLRDVINIGFRQVFRAD
jgi:hypothetical protein